MGPNNTYIWRSRAILLAAFLLFKTGDWIWSYFAKPNEPLLQALGLVAAVVAGLVAYRNERIYTVVVDVTGSWRSRLAHRKETYYATIVVIVTVFISTVILSTFDAIWRSWPQGYQVTDHGSDPWR